MPTRGIRLTRRTNVLWRRYESAAAALVISAGITIFASGLVPPTGTCVVGDMRWRYDARVPPDIRDVYLDARRIGVGFGAAAVGGWNGLGDALAVDGRVYVRHTNRAAPRYYDLAVNRYFQSNAFVFVPAGRSPSAFYRLEVETHMDQLLENLARAYPQGVIAAGVLRFAPLRTIAMSAPAVSGEPVTRRAVRYYTRPMEKVGDSWAYVVIVTARAGEDHLAAALPPTAMRSLASGHALALRLRAWPVDTTPALAQNAVAVGQLLKDARAVDGRLSLYPISHLAACTGARAAISGAPSH